MIIIVIVCPVNQIKMIEPVKDNHDYCFICQLNSGLIGHSIIPKCLDQCKYRLDWIARYIWPRQVNNRWYIRLGSDSTQLVYTSYGTKESSMVTHTRAWNRHSSFIELSWPQVIKAVINVALSYGWFALGAFKWTL